MGILINLAKLTSLGSIYKLFSDLNLVLKIHKNNFLNNPVSHHLETLFLNIIIIFPYFIIFIISKPLLDQQILLKRFNIECEPYAFLSS